LSTAPFDVFIATFLRDVGDKSITEKFREPLDFKCEAIGASDGCAVFLTIDGEAVADQDLIGMTVAEGRLSIFDEVVRERDLSFAALAFAKACADFALPVFDNQKARRPLRARRSLSRGGWVGRIGPSFPSTLASSCNLCRRSARFSDGRAQLRAADPTR
jgi:hypothetical protein